VNAPRRGFGNAVDGVRFLSSHSDSYNAWIVLDEFAHRFPAQTPHARQIANSVMLFKVSSANTVNSPLNITKEARRPANLNHETVQKKR